MLLIIYNQMKNGPISNYNNGGSFDSIFFLCLMI